MPPIDPPRKAPDFTLPDQAGDLFRLSDHDAHMVVLFFYAGDNTEACARQAGDFSRLRDDFARAGAVVAGVSTGTVAGKRRFADTCALRIPLLADDGFDRRGNPDVCARYGVWDTKQLYGRTYTGLIRTTYLIGPARRVARRWDRVRTPGHAQAVLEKLMELGLPPVRQAGGAGPPPTD